MKRPELYLFLLLPFFSVAQSVDYNKIIVPDQVASVSFEERLVQLAWKNHPTNKVATQKVEMAQALKAKASWAWLDHFFVQANVNEFTGNTEVDGWGRAFYPKYNVGVKLPIGTFIHTPLNAHAAKDQVLINEFEVNAKKLAVRRDVLQSVEKLRERFKVIKLREQIKEDYLLMFQDAEKKFKEGKITLEFYRGTIQAYTLQEEEIIQAQSLFNQERLALEELVGVELKDVEGYLEFTNRLTRESQIKP
ncbi:TolC family protein [Chryseolinea sp. H1M3-3]|uniref:TolC family protein n=1 Tax=Chryseolinea sp. H1M3-3 TaxID=3034144 RepID=UPI0023EB0249|nr:TolC family protein [Chryseolinea sp. H1M3-3]